MRRSPGRSSRLASSSAILNDPGQTTCTALPLLKYVSETHLNEVIRRFRDGAEALPDAIVVLNSDWTIIWCNKLAQQLVGLRWPQDERQRIDNLIRNPEFQTYIQHKQFDQPLELSSPVNEDLVLEYRMLQYGDDQHLLIVRDVTQLKLLEQVRKDFVANVSHELRTPLTVLQGYLEVMDADIDRAWWRAYRRRLEITRALVTQPKFMMLDEPFAGVDPIAVHDIQTIVAGLRTRGIGVLISDHNVEQTLDIVDRAYIMYDGEVRVSGTVRELVFDDTVADIYLGPTLTARLRARFAESEGAPVA